jgi:hypothetical protein
MTRDNFTAFVLVMLIIGTAVNTALVVHGAGRQKQDERRTCEVQARGLPASHIQATMWRDIGAIVGAIPVAAAPPAGTVQSRAYYALLNLRKETPRYAAIIAKQPRTRTC